MWESAQFFHDSQRWRCLRVPAKMMFLFRIRKPFDCIKRIRNNNSVFTNMYKFNAAPTSAMREWNIYSQLDKKSPERTTQISRGHNDCRFQWLFLGNIDQYNYIHIIVIQIQQTALPLSLFESCIMSHSCDGLHPQNYQHYFQGEKNNGFDVLYHNMKHGLVSTVSIWSDCEIVRYFPYIYRFAAKTCPNSCGNGQRWRRTIPSLWLSWHIRLRPDVIRALLYQCGPC